MYSQQQNYGMIDWFFNFKSVHIPVILDQHTHIQKQTNKQTNKQINKQTNTHITTTANYKESYNGDWNKTDATPRTFEPYKMSLIEKLSYTISLSWNNNFKTGQSCKTCLTVIFELHIHFTSFTYLVFHEFSLSL